MYPLDTLKTRIQSPAFQQTYRSATAVAERTLWRNLYQGVGTVALVAVPSSGVFFTTYEGLKYALENQAVLPQPVVHAIASSAAQLVNCAIVTPAEVLKQNAQMLGSGSTTTAPIAAAALHPRSMNRNNLEAVIPRSASSSSPTLLVLRRIKRHPTALWRGYTALAARDLPFTALQFPALEYLRGKLLELRRQSRSRSRSKSLRLQESGEQQAIVEIGMFERVIISGVAAGTAGSAAAWVTTPFDVVKTRMMLEADGGDGKDGRKRKRKSGLQIGRAVLQKEGVRGLFRGGSVRAAFTVLGNGLYIGCYEGAKMYLQEDQEEHAIVV